MFMACCPRRSVNDEEGVTSAIPKIASQISATEDPDAAVQERKAPPTTEINNHCRRTEPASQGSQAKDQEAILAPQMPRFFHTEAWTEKSIQTITSPQIGVDFTTPPVKMPAIVVWWETSSPTRLLTSKGLGREVSIKPGSHAFVLLPGESGLRVAIMAYPFGEVVGHPNLSREEPVVFAGEVEFNAAGQLVRWNNMSGTYKSPESLAPQAGLPMEKFYAVRPRLPSGIGAAPPPCPTCLALHFESDENVVNFEHHSLIQCRPA